MKSGVILLTIALCAFANATEKRLKRTAVSKVRDVVEAVLFGEEKLEEIRRNIPESKGNFFVLAVEILLIYMYNVFDYLII